MSKNKLKNDYKQGLYIKNRQKSKILNIISFLYIIKEYNKF